MVKSAGLQMNWKSLYAAKQAEIRQLADLRVSEVTPSVRSFSQYVTTHKQELALIAALKRTDPRIGRTWHDRDLVILAQECDDAEVSAVAVYTEPTVFGSSPQDLQAIASAVSAPVLQLDLILHPAQIHHARLRGADAVLLVAGAVDVTTLTSLVTVASSLHVAPVVAVETSAEIRQALTAGAFLLGLTSPSGMLGLALIDTLAVEIPVQKTVIVLDEIRTPEEYAALRGKVDAVFVSELVLDAAEVDAALRSLTMQ
jgi:indole-3-glycerol phosphate synthase